MPIVVTDMAGSFNADETANDSDGAAEAVHANKWPSQHRYMQVEAFAQIDAAEIDLLLSITTQAA